MEIWIACPALICENAGATRENIANHATEMDFKFMGVGLC
jgi:hypothetical protein